MPPSKNPELAARKILRDLGLKKAPISLDVIVKKLGVRLAVEPFDEELSGVLVKEGGAVAIGVNSAHHVNRQRFTVAHEIGHYVLDHPGEMFIDKTLRQKAVVVRRDGRSSEGTDKHEIEANRFAAELLMPGNIVEEEVKKRLSKSKRPSADDLINEMAGLFQVSNQAMEIRLVNLGFLIPQ
jgi:Zn-dependent peptidase ImmA (M78 family)